MAEISPKIPIETSVLKDTLRRGLTSNASRAYWWPYLPNIPSTDTISSYPNLVETAERLGTILGDVETIPQESTKNKEKEIVLASSNSLMQVLVRSKIISNDETLNFDVLLRICMHTLKRPDLTCMLAGDLLSNREKYLDPDQEAHACFLADFRDLLNAFSPKTYISLLSTGALEDRFLDLMFQDFFIELLPPEVVLRVIDAFLLEGKQILIRYGLAIIRAYKTQIKANTYSTATNFWLAVKADAANAATKANTAMFYKTLGREERLPTADPFVIFSKAKNPEFLETYLIYDYPFDESRSMFAKIRRPMTLTTKRTSFTSPLSAINTNSAGAASSPMGGSSTKASMSRKSSFTASTPRSSVADMILSQNPNANQNQEIGSSPVTPTGSNVPVLARRGSVNGASFKLDKRRPSGPEGSPLPPAPASSYTSPVPTQTSTDSSLFSGGSALSPPPPQSQGGASRELATMELEAVAGAMSFSSAILSSSTAHRLLEYIAQPLPEAYNLVFTTGVREHGHTLSALYAALAGRSSGILAVKLSAPYEHIVLGAYFDVPLVPGDAPVSSPQAGVFCVNKSSVSYLPQIATFVPASDKLVFGGVLAGTRALRLNESLELVFTDACVPFGLADQERGEKTGFAIKEIEVYGAQFSVEKGSNNLTSDINEV